MCCDATLVEGSELQVSSLLLWFDSIFFLYFTVDSSPFRADMGKTIAEKIFAAHLVDKPAADIRVLRLDRVFCHEITTPIAINDWVRRGRDQVYDPTRIKAVIDHVTPAKDSETAPQ